MSVSRTARKYLANRRTAASAWPACAFVIYNPEGIMIAKSPSNGSRGLAWYWLSVKAYIGIDVGSL